MGIHLIVDRQGPPLSIGICAANLHDSRALIPSVRGIPSMRSRCGLRRRRPRKFQGGKGCDYRHLRRWLASHGIRHRLACKGIAGIETERRWGRADHHDARGDTGLAIPGQMVELEGTAVA